MLYLDAMMAVTECNEANDDDSYLGQISTISPIIPDSGLSSGTDSSRELLTSISSLSFEKCTDVHVGPKVILNKHFEDGESNLVNKLAEKWIVPSKKGHCRSYRRFTVGLLVVLILLLICLTLVEWMKWKMEVDGRKNPTERPTNDTYTSTTANPPEQKTTKEPPVPPHTSDSPSTRSQNLTTPTPHPTPPQLDFVPRETWKGLAPPDNSNRTGYHTRFIFIDNLPEGKCVGNATLLKCLEDEFNEKTSTKKEALKFSFLIDKTGMVYEVRGWRFLADDNFIDAYKIGFIGDTVNDTQVNNFRKFVTESSSWGYISETYNLKPECCRDLDKEDERGPGSSIICHLYESPLRDNLDQCYTDVQNCDTRSWIAQKMPWDICGNWDFRPY